MGLATSASGDVREPGGTTRRDGGRRALVWFLCLLMLSASGRVGSSDAGAQLQASLRLVTSGSPSAPKAFGIDPQQWVAAPSGRFYEAHDIGGLLLMAPAAW